MVLKYKNLDTNEEFKGLDILAEFELYDIIDWVNMNSNSTYIDSQEIDDNLDSSETWSLIDELENRGYKVTHEDEYINTELLQLILELVQESKIIIENNKKDVLHYKTLLSIIEKEFF